MYEDYAVCVEIRNLLRKHMSEYAAGVVMNRLGPIMHDPTTAEEFVRLIQKWGACV